MPGRPKGEENIFNTSHLDLVAFDLSDRIQRPRGHDVGTGFREPVTSTRN